MGVLACAFAFIGTLLFATLVLEQVPHLEDEVAYLFEAKVIATGRLYVPTPDHSAFFFSPFVIDHEGRRFGKYPPGYPALLSIGILLGAPWWINAASAALTIALLFRLGREIYSPTTAALTALLGAMSPFLIILSGTYMSHPTCLLWLALFFLWTRYAQQRSWPWGFPAGLAWSTAFLTRPFTALILAIPWGVTLLRHTHRTRDPRPILSIALGALPGSIGLLAFNTTLTGDPLRLPYTLLWPYDRVGFGPDVGIGGHTPLLALNNIFLTLAWLSTHLLGWPAISLIPAFLPLILSPRDRRDLFCAAVAASLSLGYGLYWFTGELYGPRYIYEALPAWLLLTARGLQRVHHLTTTRGRRRVLYTLIAGLTALNLIIHLPAQARRYKGLYGIDGTPLRILRQAHLQDALVFVVNERWQDYAIPFLLNTPDLDGPVIYARDLGEQNAVLAQTYPDRTTYCFNGEVIFPHPPTGCEPSNR